MAFALKTQLFHIVVFNADNTNTFPHTYEMLEWKI